MQTGAPGRHGFQEPNQLKAGLYTLLGMAALVVMIVAWPASVFFSLALLAWRLSRKGSSSFTENLEDASFAVLIGTGAFCVVSVVAQVWSYISEEAQRAFFEAEQWMLEARRYVHAISGPDLTIYLSIMALLLVSLYFFPQSGAIGKFLRVKKRLVQLHLCLLAFTSFTLFGSYRGDTLARKEHERLLARFEIGLRKELDSDRQLLKVESARKAVRDALKDGIPEPARSRLIYLMRTVQGPAYKEVLDRQKDGLKHRDSRTGYKYVPIAGSSIRTEFIRDLLSETLEKVVAHGAQAEASHAGRADDADIDSLARKLLGGVAETQDEWRRQQDLINEEPERSEQSEEIYKEASKGLREAMATMLSEALGGLTPEMRGLAKEWMGEMTDVIVPLFERRLQGRAEAIVNWARGFISSPGLAVPQELAQEAGPPSTVLGELLMPTFLMKGLPRKTAGSVASDGAALRDEVIPDEIVGKLFWRVEEAEVKLGGGLQKPKEEAGKEPPAPDVHPIVPTDTVTDANLSGPEFQRLVQTLEEYIEQRGEEAFKLDAGSQRMTQRWEEQTGPELQRRVNLRAEHASDFDGIPYTPETTRRMKDELEYRNERRRSLEREARR